jgi:putative endonuclease
LGLPEKSNPIRSRISPGSKVFFYMGRDGRKEWVVYILECGDRTLYTGCTNDLELRLKRHQSGRGARYTRARLPVRLVYFRRCPDRSSALKGEWAIKRLSRPDKKKLIARSAAVSRRKSLN